MLAVADTRVDENRLPAVLDHERLHTKRDATAVEVGHARGHPVVRRCDVRARRLRVEELHGDVSRLRLDDGRQRRRTDGPAIDVSHGATVVRGPGQGRVVVQSTSNVRPASASST